MRDDFADLLLSSFVHVLEYALCIEILHNMFNSLMLEKGVGRFYE